jgi:type IV pilus assembly protein PilO
MALSLHLGRRPLVAQVVVGVVAVSVIAIAYYLIIYSDVARDISNQTRQNAALKEDLAKAKQAEFDYHKDLVELTERQQKQRELNKVLPQTTEHPAFLSAVQGVANVSGVVLQGWNPQDEILQKFYAKVPMKVSLSGKYHQIAKFFYGVGQLDRIINVENISLTAPRVVGDEVQLKVECLTTAFRAVGGAAAPTKPAAPAGGAKP